MPAYKKKKRERKLKTNRSNKSTAVGRDLFRSVRMCFKSTGSCVLKDDTDTGRLTPSNLPQERRGGEGKRGRNTGRAVTSRREAGARR